MIRIEKATYLALITVFFWSTIAVVSKQGTSKLNVDQFLLYSTIISTIIFYVYLIKIKKIFILIDTFKSAPLFFIIYGLMNPFLTLGLLLTGYQHLPATIGMSINFTWPITFMLISWLILKENLTKKDFFYCILGYVGVLIIILGNSLTSHKALSLFGILIMFLFTICWSLYWILSKKNKHDSLISLTIGFTISIPFLIIYTYLNGHLNVNISNSNWIYIILFACFEMGFSYILWQKAIDTSSKPSSLGMLIFLSPPLSIIWIYFILGEPITPWLILGLFTIIASLYFKNRKAN